MKTSIPFFPARAHDNPHSGKRDALLHSIESHRAQIEDLVRRHQKSDPALAERARSLLVFLRGGDMTTITRVTGLSQNTILRVRRRFEAWGVGCIAEPQPRKTTRTSIQGAA